MKATYINIGKSLTFNIWWRPSYILFLTVSGPGEQWFIHIIVTAQLNLNMKAFIMGRKPPTTPSGTFKALPGNLGSWFSVYNLILNQEDEIC